MIAMPVTRIPFGMHGMNKSIYKGKTTIKLTLALLVCSYRTFQRFGDWLHHVDIVTLALNAYTILNDTAQNCIACKRENTRDLLSSAISYMFPKILDLMMPSQLMWNTDSFYDPGGKDTISVPMEICCSLYGW